MKAFRMPDIIAVALICSLPVAFIILVVWPLVQDDEWRLVIWATSSILQAILTFAWSTIASRFRVPVYRWYYRVFGPRCDVRVSATMQVNPYHSNKQLMDTALDLARKWNGEAHERVRIPRRSVILAGHRTLTVEVEGREPDEGSFHGPTEGIGYVLESVEADTLPESRIVRVNLTGYAGTLTRMESILQKEVSYLLESLTSQMSYDHDGLMFTLEARLEGTNPFLGFYLRDVPMARSNEFTLDINESTHGNLVHVKLRNDYINVGARSSATLVESARHYLATPALANRN